MRARLALSVSSEPYEHREVVLRNKPPELLAASPKGTVPVLVLAEGDVIDQSLDVMLWTLRRSDPKGWLTAAPIDDMLALIAGNDSDFKQHLDRYKYPNRYAHEFLSDAHAFALAQRAAGARWLEKLDAMLEVGWLFGSTASLADMALLPFVRQFAHTDARWFSMQPWPRLQKWLADFEASSAYAGVMGKHDAWHAPQA